MYSIKLKSQCKQFNAIEFLLAGNLSSLLLMCVIRLEFSQFRLIDNGGFLQINANKIVQTNIVALKGALLLQWNVKLHKTLNVIMSGWKWICSLNSLLAKQLFEWKEHKKTEWNDSWMPETGHMHNQNDRRCRLIYIYEISTTTARYTQ